MHTTLTYYGEEDLVPGTPADVAGFAGPWAAVDGPEQGGEPGGRPPAWRWVNSMGPRASRKPEWPASSRRARSSSTCRAEAGGPVG